MMTPRITEQQKAKKATYQTRIDALREKQIAALNGQNVDEYNILAKSLMEDMQADGIGGYSLAKVVDGKTTNWA